MEIIFYFHYCFFLFLYRKFSEWDVARTTPAAELVKARRELDIAENQLVEKRQEEIERRKEMDKNWSELRRKELIFRQSFQKFNKFAKENQDKRERAEHKIADEISLQDKRKEEVINSLSIYYKRRIYLFIYI